MTLQDIIRTYADGVEAGQFDTDLDRRERRLTVLALRTASNVGHALVPYRQATDDDRERIIKYLTDALWTGNVRFFLAAVSPSGEGERAYDVAIPRAIVILRGI